MTELALIPPFSFQMEFVWFESNYLFLPQFMGRADYAFYIREAARDAAHTTLDNGAFEGRGTDIITLMKLAKRHNIQEVVLPDVLGSKTGTLDKLKEVASVFPRTDWASKQFMCVVQGKDFAECCDFIKTAAAHQFPFKTFGLPKHLLRTVKGSDSKSIRLRLALYIRKLYGPRFDIHFLGASPLWIGEARHLRELNVRSMDTSMPFVYALAGEDLFKAAAKGIEHERQENYFHVLEIDEELLMRNVNYMLRMISG